MPDIASLLSALAEAGQPAAGTVAARLRAAEQQVHDPRVDRHALAGGGGFDPGLEALGEPQGDAGAVVLVGRSGDPVVLGHDDELWLAAGEAGVGAGAPELAGEAGRRLGQGPAP